MSSMGFEPAAAKGADEESHSEPRRAVHRRGRRLPGVLAFRAARPASDGARGRTWPAKSCQAAKALACPFDTAAGGSGRKPALSARITSPVILAD